MIWLVIGVVGTVFAIVLLQYLIIAEAGGENDEMEECVDGEDEIL